MRTAALLLCGALAACGGEPQTLTTSELVYAVDGERVRALGWAPAEASAAELVAAAVTKLKRRLPFDDAATVTAYLDTKEIHIRFDSALPEAAAERIAAATESLGVLELFLLPTDEELEGMGLGRDSERIVRLRRRNPATGTESVLALLPASFERCFGAGNFGAVTQATDAQGYPALGFELEGAGVARDFRAFTGDHLNMHLAIAIHDEIRSAPTIAEPLPGAGVITGLADEAEVQALLAELQSGEGPLRRVR